MRFFVTGTGTDVGKTYVTTRVIRELAQTSRVKAMKPVESGCARVDGALVPADALALQQAVSKQDLNDINLYRYEAALDPLAAATEEGASLPRFEAIAALAERLESTADHLVIEGAGGLEVPLTATGTCLDLIEYLGARVILVAPHELGTINHTILTLQRLRTRGILTCAIVLNEVKPQTALASSVAAISQYFQPVTELYHGSPRPRRHFPLSC